jgi:hypothetical protein
MAETIKTGPLYLETSRDKRLEVRQQTVQWFKESKDETGRFPTLVIGPWFEEPNPPWPRGPFTIPMNEVFYNTELHYAALLEMLTARAIRFYQSVNATNKDGSNVVVNPELLKRSEEWEKQHRDHEDAVLEAELPGLEGSDADGMKFLVFRTANISRQNLERFLETREQPDPRSETFRVFQAFSYLLADTGFILDNTNGSTNTTDLGHFPPSRFIGKSIQDFLQSWDEIIRPLKNCRSFYATRCFIILDAITAKDGKDTVGVVTVTSDGWCTRRVSYGALNKGILKAFEMLTLDPDMIELDERNVITEDKYYGPSVDG